MLDKLKGLALQVNDLTRVVSRVFQFFKYNIMWLVLKLSCDLFLSDMVCSEAAIERCS